MDAEKDRITDQLKAARDASGLSQRDLTAMTGIQQAQLSKIENGSVDPRLASLTTIARALELELVLVPRRSLPAVKAILNGNKPASRPAYSLDDEADDD